MQAPGAFLRRSRPQPVDLLATAVSAAYAAGIVWTVLEQRVSLLAWLVVAPLLVVPLYLLRRRELAPSVHVAYLWIWLWALATFLGFVVLFAPLLLGALPAMFVASVFCRRYPATAVTAMFIVAATFGSETALGYQYAGPTVDVFLGGLWLAFTWGWLVGGRRRRTASLWPGVAALGLYIVLTLISSFATDSISLALQSFRASIWYLSALLLVAYAPWPADTRARITRGLLVVILAVGAYAVLRWIIGPTHAERALVARDSYNSLNGQVRPAGSFTSPKELAAWCAITIPFCLAFALMGRGRSRWVACAALAISAVAMLAADVRAGPGAAVPGVIVVLALYSLARAYSGRRGMVPVIALAGTLAVGGSAFALTLGHNQDSGRRYRAIVAPSTDPSYQARLFKWRSAIDDIQRAPLGHGMGAAGRTHQRSGRFQTIASIDVDNSYLKIALEQGFAVMIFFIIAVAMFGVGLGRRALSTQSPERACMAIGACGTLTALVILFFIGVYIEGLPALAAWVLIGLGASAFTWRDRAPGPI